MALYADDTKIWRRILLERDHETLQNDINYLNDWTFRNKMNFHPQKCKVISVSLRDPPLLGILPNVQYFYTLGSCPLEYADFEKDLGVYINPKLNFNDHCNRLYDKANQKFGLTKRTCYFVNDVKRKRSLYLSLIRSQFEHCSPVWRPTIKSMLNKLESLQKRCIKWILSEEYIRYNSHVVYMQKCRQVNLLPISFRFDLNDLILFYKVVNNLIPLKLPDYLSFYTGNTRLRSCHLDNMSIVSNIGPKIAGYSDNQSQKRTILNKSFFYRTHTKWNSLPMSIRKIDKLNEFRNEVIKHFWKNILEFEENSDEDDLIDIG